MKHTTRIATLSLLAALLLTAARTFPSPATQAGSSDPPAQVVKLIFIHHSTGENWLQDGYGNLGQVLGENNYFVSDTNYGWGPDGIGDRTDIPDWLEWFYGPDTETYFQALVQESGQHSDYTRNLPDPGGENQIIMFKSCFPNSDLEGNPDDPPSEDGWLSVGHAKYVYNHILEFFGQHPERLFIVVTAPPLSDSSHAANARAFNQWLVYDWLEENDYPYQNVAVFDFYNVLTGADGHHTFQDGAEIHEVARKDTLHYPSDDDHPSRKGSQKATEEFVPLLNYFYHRWQASNPPQLAPGTGEGGAPAQGMTPQRTGLIDDFDGNPPAGSNGWEAFWDESTSTSLQCTVESEGGLSGGDLRIDYQIAPYSWGTCGLFYDLPQDWSGADGVAFSMRSETSEGSLDIDLYAEGSEGRESYVARIPITSEMEEDWSPVALAWEDFRRVDWEADAGSAFAKPELTSGLAFGFSVEDEEIEGVIWIDDVGWMSGEPSEAAVSEDSDQSVEEDNGEQARPRWNIPCPGSLALGGVGMALAGRQLVQKKRSLTRRG
jgi:hypothetical protein